MDSLWGEEPEEGCFLNRVAGDLAVAKSAVASLGDSSPKCLEWGVVYLQGRICWKAYLPMAAAYPQAEEVAVVWVNSSRISISDICA